jgi:hypothetical protein
MWWLLLLGGAAAEIRRVGVTAYMGCYKITSAASNFNLRTAACCDDGTTSGSNCQYCPECFLLEATGTVTYTLENCPGYVNADTDYSSSTCDGATPPNCEGHYVRQYQFINIAGTAQVISDGENGPTTSDITIAAGTSKTVMCYNGQFYPL